jgi:exosortase
MGPRWDISVSRLLGGASPRVLASLMVLATAAIALTWDAWRDMARLAMRDEESSHILLVPLVVFWLAWVRRSRLRHCRRIGTWVGPVIAAVGAGCYVLGDTLLMQSVWHGGAVLLLVGACLTIWGREVLVSFLPVFVVLVFLIPVPGRVRQAIAIPLQTATASATQEVCAVVGLPVERSGNLLRINGVEVAVAEACNGMRMTFALMLVSYAFAFSTPLKGYVRVLLIGLSPLSAIACNVIRLVPTLWVFGNWSEETAELFHDLSGWVMLFAAFLLLMSVIRLLRWAAVPVTAFSLARD